MRVLVLGVTSMLGYALSRSFQENKSFDLWGTLRCKRSLNHFPSELHHQLISNVDVLQQDELINVFEQVRPDVVINCVGIVKQGACAKDPLAVLPVNALFPHKLARICALLQARLIHLSTDCVFSGAKGTYVESDHSDAHDLYGKSKFIGELPDSKNAVTLRTSFIGHELNSNHALVDWFLSQSDKVKGYVNAIYTGLPTIEIARVIQDYVIPNNNLVGLYHVAAKPINKLDLLNLIAQVYKKNIIIEPDNGISIDRSLCAKRFEKQTGYIAPDWPALIEKMYQSQKTYRSCTHVS